MNLAEAEKNFAALVNKVHTEGISIDLEQDDKIIARLIPVKRKSPLTVGKLNELLANSSIVGR